MGALGAGARPTTRSKGSTIHKDRPQSPSRITQPLTSSTKQETTLSDHEAITLISVSEICFVRMAQMHAYESIRIPCVPIHGSLSACLEEGVEIRCRADAQ